jgi:poly(hydroxyalkanoate) granule-associated protein
MSARKKGAGGDAARLEKQVKESAHRIWLAGLGAFALAEEEGGKLFKSLVAKGESLESSGRDRLEALRAEVEDAAGVAKEKLESATGEVRERAGEAWKKVERELDERVGSALERVGVPSRGEIARLTRRIEELTALVEKQTRARRAPARKRAAERPAGA